VHSQAFPEQTIRPNLGDLILFPATISAGNVMRFPSDEALANVHIADMVFSTRPFQLSDIRARLTAGISNRQAAIASTRPVQTNVLNLTGHNIVNTANV
jgi:hypothetical protein